MRLITFNIRHNNPTDGEHVWPNRRPMVRELLQFYRPDVLGVQEALASQVKELAEDLSIYDVEATGRDDGRSGGEHCPIYWRRDAYARLDGGTFWLSETPDLPGSKGWGAGITRICTWTRLKPTAGREVLVMNLHLDHRNADARREAGELVGKRAKTLTEAAPADVVICGDFNAPPESPPLQRLAARGFRRDRDIAEHVLGPASTFGTFVVRPDWNSPIIDHVLVDDAWSVDRVATLAHHWNGRHASDHHAVLADLSRD
jgi:endonuclease/exonuclease/phosphatase family metal-dependent hydrolase